MGILDFLKLKQFKLEIENLKNDIITKESKISELENLKLTLEQQTVFDLEQRKNKLLIDIDSLENQISLAQVKYNELHETISKLNDEIVEKENQIITLNDDIHVQDFGLYVPRYDCSSSLVYKQRLDLNRDEQKTMIKDKTAVHINKNWTVDGSKSKGSKMINDTVKMMLLSFNNECEAAINKIKYNNIESIGKRIINSAIKINSLNKTMSTYITEEFLNLKLDELHIAYEYELKKQEEKEILREQREKEREEKALQKEVDSKKKKLDKEISHMSNAIEELEIKILTAADEEKSVLQSKIEEIRDKISAYENEKIELDYRLENLGAGYVYIISNIGSFGSDVFKIGVTRRLDPMDRVHELGDASVPFKFDVHALIFSYKAYELETELHRVFDEYKINMVNNRKEFFRISIDEIEKELVKYKDLTIDFNKVPEAKEYNESLKIRQSL